MAHKREGHHDRGPHAEAAAAEREIIAHFPTEGRARQAEHHIASQAMSIQVQEVPETRVHEEVEAAHEGVSTVELGPPAWVGLLLGAVVGAILGGLVYANRIVIAGVAPALSAGPVAMGLLGVGVLGAIGWLMGALVHLYRTPRVLSIYEIRAVVPEDARVDVQRKLVAAGAAEVLVMGDGTSGSGQPEHRRGKSETGARGGSHH